MEQLNYEEELKNLYDLAVEEKDVGMALELLGRRNNVCCSRHDGACSIYAVLGQGIIEAGICTCGYGHRVRGKDGSDEKMYSVELVEKNKQVPPDAS